ncbi:uncharacterized protein UV8b_03259 [Ustilaginoidea virens]|nr:uncharacterized protein UV8b_03259 [Ustilaginoidea virens]QUC19018.1 hypothetical protein UV8b_03259 [Ustilaginoidea virens]
MNPLLRQPPNRLMAGGAILFFTLFMFFVSKSHNLSMPGLSRTAAAPSMYNQSKVALLVEDRPQPLLAPLLLHFIYSLPADWTFRFMGSYKSVRHLAKSAAIREHVRAGKLDLTYTPFNMSTKGQEMISRFLTTLWLYDTVLQPAELLLVFQSDSMVCSNCKHHLDEYLDYDWVGAPWNAQGNWGGNGGLSLRRVSRIVDVLQKQKRKEDSDPEDVWLSERLGHHATGKVANGSVSLTFSGEINGGEVERIDPDSDYTIHGGELSLEGAGPADFVAGIDDWRNGFYEPMGYHIGGTGYMHGGIWGTRDKRKHIYQYCPEAKMILQMDMANYVPGDCGNDW